jgi:hypothetical protein
MIARVSDEELAEALEAAEDAYGNDLRLAEAVAQMTPEQRAQSEANLRSSIAQARATLRRRASRNV